MSGKWQSEANRPASDGNMQYHIRCRTGDVNKYVLLPGDPERVDIIAHEWDEARFIANNREHRTYSGIIDKNIKITACSTGMGGPSTSIALEELAELGADTFIRVGSCGAINENIKCGDLIICSGAMRQDGTSDDYIEKSYPAMANYEVTAALVQACENLNLNYHVGVSCTSASFYCGQARPGFKNYYQSGFENKIQDLNRAGVLCFEMEAATIFTLSGIYGLRAGGIFAVMANRISNEFIYTGIDDSVRAANEAVKILASWDNLKQKNNKKHWFPALN